MPYGFSFCEARGCQVTSFALPVPVTPISTPGCLYRFGIYPESVECSSNYIKCAHGVPHTTPCEPGLAYDDKTHSCNWPDLLLDFCNPEGNTRVSYIKSSNTSFDPLTVSRDGVVTYWYLMVEISWVAISIWRPTVLRYFIILFTQ